MIRLIGIAALTVFSAGLSMGGMADGEEKKQIQGTTRGTPAIRELLDYFYQCRECGEDRIAGPGESIWFRPVVELPSHSGRTVAAIWVATSQRGLETVNGADPGQGRGVAGRTDLEVTQTLAYLGGNWGSQVSERARAADESRRGRDSHAFGQKGDSLAAVPEPAPIFLLGTVLLATFSIARLRFSR